MKTIIKSPYLLFFVVIAIVHLAAILMNQIDIAQFSKVLLVPTLMLHIVAAYKNQLRLVIMVLVSLLFCWAGDILLLYSTTNEVFFLLGLAAFLLGHIFYIVSFKKLSDFHSIGKPLSALFYLLPLVYAISLLIVLYPALGDMTLPVIIYALVISAMCVAAMWRWQKTNQSSFNYVIIGAAFFILSDSLIAINKFHTPFKWAGFLIMLTYIIAQFLIVIGLMKHLNVKVNSTT